MKILNWLLLMGVLFASAPVAPMQSDEIVSEKSTTQLYPNTVTQEVAVVEGKVAVSKPKGTLQPPKPISQPIKKQVAQYYTQQSDSDEFTWRECCLTTCCFPLVCLLCACGLSRLCCPCCDTKPK